MYYICKFSDTWSVMDSDDHSNQPLDAAEVELIKKRFPKLVSNGLMDFIGVDTINPKKLLTPSKLPPKTNSTKLSAKSEKN